MEPVFEYFNLIVNRLQNPLPKTEYGENHHIYPKSCGGLNHISNIVRLTPEEHYRCHLLLTKIYADEPENFEKMVYAWHLMSYRDKNITAEEYGELKRTFSKMHSEKLKQKGIRPPSEKGRVFSEEWKKRISESMKGFKHSEETRKKMSESHKGLVGPWRGKKRPKEQCQKMLDALKGRKWFTDGTKAYFIRPDDPKIAELHLLPGRK